MNEQLRHELRITPNGNEILVTLVISGPGIECSVSEHMPRGDHPITAMSRAAAERLRDIAAALMPPATPGE